MALTKKQLTNWENWIVALQSGRYKQKRGQLYSRNPERPVDAPKEMCCLGVACDISFRGTRWHGEGYGTTMDGLCSYPPYDRFVAEFGTDMNSDMQGKLAALNDRSASYNKVVKFLKKELTRLRRGQVNDTANR